MIIHWLTHKLGLARCPQCETLVDYAMDGLEPKQQTQVKQHLSDCPSCMEQVRDFWQVKEGLGMCAPEASEPKDFNAKVLARLNQEHNAPGAPDPATRASRHLGGWPRFWMTVGPVFAGMSLVMTMVAFGALLGGTKVGPRDAMAAELAAMSQELLNDPKAARISLVAASDKAGSEGNLVLCPGRATALLKAHKLSKCEQGRNYALWAKPKNGGQPERLARFAVEADGSSMHMLNLSQPWKADGAVDFMVTQDSGPQAGETWLTGSLSL